MKATLLFSMLLVASAAHSQTKPYKPETDGAYYSSKDRAAALAARRPFGIRLDSTLTGLAALDAHNGFRGYIFGTSVAAYPALRKWSEQSYIARREPMLIGNATISALTFHARDRLLTGATFLVSGEDNVRQVLEALKAQYGPPQEITLDKMVWHGKVVTLVFETKITNFSAPIASIKHMRGTVRLYNNALSGPADAVQAAATKKAMGDL